MLELNKMKLLLKKYFGYDEFKPLQLEVINNVLAKKDSFVLMPTGGGKSLCYQIPALKFDGLTIVISPLISLMKDQVDALKTNGVLAEYINSTLSLDVIKDIKTRILEGEVKILYITPERLAMKSFRASISTVKVSLVAIDEAHCISEWGHDFRKDYLGLRFLKDYFDNVPVIALTATATQKVKDDILKRLKLNDPKIFISSFDRDNLNLIVREKKNSFAQILALAEKYKDESIIIYCHSRKDTQNLADDLNKYGFKALMYHAGLSDRVRERNQEAFVNDKVNIMVATIAFGMGIDKSNVRLVIHNTFSKSLEGYYQEVGRAGRDGLASECVLFYSKADIKRHEFFIDQMSNSALRTGSRNKLNEMISYCEINSCRRKYLLEYFGEEVLEDNCQGCDICLHIPVIKESDIKKSLIKKPNLFNSDLFKELQNLRKEVAKDNKIVPSHVFGDISLRAMATTLPATEKDFMSISGVSQQKLNDFGEDFLILINEYLMVDEIVNKNQEIIPEDKPVFNKFKKKKKYSINKKWKKSK